VRITDRTIIKGETNLSHPRLRRASRDSVDCAQSDSAAPFRLAPERVRWKESLKTAFAKLSKSVEFPENVSFQVKFVLTAIVTLVISLLAH
jgi:hypothetical protein